MESLSVPDDEEHPLIYPRPRAGTLAVSESGLIAPPMFEPHAHATGIRGGSARECVRISDLHHRDPSVTDHARQYSLERETAHPTSPAASSFRLRNRVPPPTSTHRSPARSRYRRSGIRQLSALAAGQRERWSGSACRHHSRTWVGDHIPRRWSTSGIIAPTVALSQPEGDAVASVRPKPA